MALAGSGAMSIGGSTATRSINLELGRSATATSNMGETDLRSLAGVSSGAISMDDFYGASSSLWAPTITVGGGTQFSAYYAGYRTSNPAIGSTTDATCDFITTSPAGGDTWGFYSMNNANAQLALYTPSGSSSEGTPTGNAGWTTCKVYNGTSSSGTLIGTQYRVAATFSQPVWQVRFWTFNFGAMNSGTVGQSRHLVFE